jgi:aerobic carbon-monoxide dehydrogenase medium subunit
MFPSEFEYERATSVEEALSLMDEHAGREIELLAGGHSLLPTIKSGLANPDVLIDISGIESMHGIDSNEEGFSIGAQTRYVEVTESDDMWAGAPAFTEATNWIGDVQVRNRGTVGGNIAHADPASDLTGGLLASDGTIIAQGPDGEREIPVDEFFMGMYATALEPEELVTRIEVPRAGENDLGAYAKKPSPSSGYPLVGVAVMLETDGEEVESARVAANNLMDHAVRLEPVEEALAGAPLEADAMEAATENATEGLDTMMMMQDGQASSEFREQLTTVYAKRALLGALDKRDVAAPAAD